MANGARTLYEIETSWSENTLNFKTMADIKPVVIGHVSSTAVDAWEEYDVSDNIRAAVVNPDKNFGFFIEFDKNRPRFEGRIASSEYPDVSLRPKLKVIYATEPFVELLYPVGGEVWRQGYTYTIKWIDNIDESIKIELYKSGTHFFTIASSTESDGQFNWDVPADMAPGTDYKIRITSVNNSSIIDTSTADIAIAEVFVISSFPYVQDFDKFNNGTILSESWSQESNDYFDWTVHSGATPDHNANWPKTGPGSDHTTGTGKYLYTEATGNIPDKRANLLTPTFDLNNLENPILTFWYHLWSQDDYDGRMGHLYVDIELDGIWTNSVFDNDGYLNDEWKKATIDLSGYTGMVNICFRGVTGKTDAGDRAVDDFCITGTNTHANNTNQTIDKLYMVYQNNDKLHFIIPVSMKNRKFLISIVNMYGKTLVKMDECGFTDGIYAINLNKHSTALPSGVYVCKFNAGNFCQSTRIIIRK